MVSAKASGAALKLTGCRLQRLPSSHLTLQIQVCVFQATASSWSLSAVSLWTEPPDKLLILSHKPVAVLSAASPEAS